MLTTALTRPLYLHFESHYLSQYEIEIFEIEDNRLEKVVPCCLVARDYRLFRAVLSQSQETSSFETLPKTV